MQPYPLNVSAPDVTRAYWEKPMLLKRRPETVENPPKSPIYQNEESAGTRNRSSRDVSNEGKWRMFSSVVKVPAAQPVTPQP
jgi:hypothetical protein